jgi:hypothetical protein
MKVWIGAATMAVLLCGAAAAQETLGAPPPNYQVPASRCAELPAAPAVVDGAAANAEGMQTAIATFNAWDASFREILQEAQAIQQARTQEFNGAVQSYNAAVASVQAEVEEYNGRQNNRRRR